MKIIAKGRSQGRTTELIKISAEKQIPIVCNSSGSVQYIMDTANKIGLKIPKPIIPNELNLVQFKNKDILIDNAEFLLQNLLHTHGIEAITVTTDENQEEKKINYFEDKVKKLKLEADKITKQLDNCKDSNEYIGRIKALEKVLELIHEYDWQEEHSEYRTGDDNHIEVSTWEQKSNGEIKNHKRYIVDKKFDDKDINQIEKELNEIGIPTRIDNMFRPMNDIFNDMAKMWSVFDDSFPSLLVGERQANTLRKLMGK
jgi:hypothetical protein